MYQVSLDLPALSDQFYCSLYILPLTTCLGDVCLTSFGDRLRALTLLGTNMDIVPTSLVPFRNTTLISMESNLGRMLKVSGVR